MGAGAGVAGLLANLLLCGPPVYLSISLSLSLCVCVCLSLDLDLSIDRSMGVSPIRHSSTMAVLELMSYPSLFIPWDGLLSSGCSKSPG